MIEMNNQSDSEVIKADIEGGRTSLPPYITYMLYATVKDILKIQKYGQICFFLHISFVFILSEFSEL